MPVAAVDIPVSPAPVPACAHSRCEPSMADCPAVLVAPEWLGDLQTGFSVVKISLIEQRDLKVPGRSCWNPTTAAPGCQRIARSSTPQKNAIGIVNLPAHWSRSRQIVGLEAPPSHRIREWIVLDPPRGGSFPTLLLGHGDRRWIHGLIRRQRFTGNGSAGMGADRCVGALLQLYFWRRAGWISRPDALAHSCYQPFGRKPWVSRSLALTGDIIYPLRSLVLAPWPLAVLPRSCSPGGSHPIIRMSTRLAGIYKLGQGRNGHPAVGSPQLGTRIGPKRRSFSRTVKEGWRFGHRCRRRLRAKLRSDLVVIL